MNDGIKQYLNINGMILLDKPSGMSSNQALQQARRIYGAAKAGHTGSLDPLASGMLPICFGEATKFSQDALNADKTYQVVAQLGIRTTTSDGEGEPILERPVPFLTTQKIDEICAAFRGTTMQVPSIYSAIKYQGKPLYFYARKGIEVPRVARQISIHHLSVDHYEQTQIGLTVHCSKGTYIRTLVDDLGEMLGCGAHVSTLRRLSVGYFKPTEMVTLEQLMIAKERNQLIDYLLPVEAAIQTLPKISISKELGRHLRQGQTVIMTESFKSESTRIYIEEQFIGVGEILENHRLVPRRLLCE